MGRVFRSTNIFYWLTFPTTLIFIFFLAHFPHVLHWISSVHSVVIFRI